MSAAEVAARLRSLTEVTDRFRAGERGVRAPDTGADEVGAVGQAVNALFDAVVESETALRNASRIAKIGAWRRTIADGAMYWSDELFELFGLERAGPPPTFETFLAMLPAADRLHLQAMGAPGNPRTSFTMKMTATRPDGAEMIVWSEARAEFDQDGGLQALFGICQDVTERESAAAQLRQALKMEAVGQLTGGLAHDFNNLLAVIIGNLDLIDDELHTPEARAFNATALEAALRGAKLTQQLLAFSRRQPLIPQTIAPNALLAQMSDIWRRTLGDGIVIRIEPAEDLWPARADPSQLEAALLNLVINARDAMDSDGMLTIESRNVTLDGATAEGEPEVAPGDYAMISVTDIGRGMTEEVLHQAVEPFFTTKEVGQGSGLGLSMVYGFAKQSGGHVNISSEPGKGTTVRLFLPRDAEAATALPAGAEAPSVLSEGELVLVVEDNDQVRHLAVRQITDMGYRVLEAADGKSALAVFDSEPGIDILFTDVVMPGGMTGMDLVAAVRLRRPGLKVLYTTGYTGAATGDAGRFTGADMLLTKPYRRSELARRLRQVLEARSPSS